MAKRTIISCDWCFADSPNGDTTTVTTDELVRERDELRERYALVTRIRALQESQIADLEARVRELEAALREIAAVDSASPEHRIAMRALGDSPAVSTPRLRRGDVVRVKGSALVELRDRLGDVLDVSGGEVLVNVATAQGPQRYWLFVEQVEPTQTARLPAGCACGGEGWCDACQIATSISSHSGAIARAEQAERERDKLEAALRAIVAIDSASPEHRIAMRALGDSPAVMDTSAPPPSPATNELTHIIDALRNEAERLADVAEEYRREGLTGHVTVTYESVQAFREVADWLESRDGQRAVAQAKESA